MSQLHPDCARHPVSPGHLERPKPPAKTHTFQACNVMLQTDIHCHHFCQNRHTPYSGTTACDVSGSTTKNIVSTRTVPVRPLLTKPPLGCQDRYDEREASLAPYVSPCDASLAPFSSLHRQQARPARTAFLVVAGLTLLAACTSSPRSGPPGGDRDSGSRARQGRSQGLSAPPAALLLVSMDTDRDHYGTGRWHRL